MTNAETFRVRVWRRRRWLYQTLAATFCAAAIVGAVLLYVQVLSGFGLMMLVYSPVALMIVGSFAWQNGYPCREPADVVCSPEGLRVGSTFIPRARLRDGIVTYSAVVRGRPSVVSLGRTGVHPRLILEVDTPDQGAALLRALRLDAAHSVAHFRLWRSAWMYIVGMYVAIVLIAIAGFGVATAADRFGLSDAGTGAVTVAAIVIVLAGILAFSSSSAVRVTVGAEGFHRKTFGRVRYVAWGSVERFEPWPGQETRYGLAAPAGFDVVLRDGERLSLRTEATRSQVLDRMEQARAAGQHGGVEGNRVPVALLRREGSFDVRVKELRELGALEGHGEYRGAAHDPELLWRIVEDPSEGPVLRARAAISLGGVQDEETRARLSAVAQATASPVLRVALEAVGSGEDGDLEQALAVLEATERTP